MVNSTLRPLLRSAEVAARRLGDLALNERFARLHDLEDDDRQGFTRDIRILVSDVRSHADDQSGQEQESAAAAATEAIGFLEQALQWLHDGPSDADTK